ncbi:MAG: trans-sulfuration enzyme family protein, partial [Acidimicrobiales bacterium]
QPASVPIYQTSTWAFSGSDDFAGVLAHERPGYAYGRGYGNPTVDAFESVAADLEGYEAAFGFSSGMSAISAVCLTLARAGDRIVASHELYGGTYAFLHAVAPRLGVEVDFVDPHDVAGCEEALPGAALFYAETIANPLCTVADLPALGEACRRAGVISIVDNTFASPWLCRPAEWGIDIVVHSVTKYLAGHSDVIGGVACSSSALRRRIRDTAIDVGGAMQPFDAWLATRGIQTLGLRQERQCASAATLANELYGRAGIAAVHYPGLAGHPHHARAKRLFRPGFFGGMLSVEIAGGAGPAQRFCELLELAFIGASLGGTHTLVAHPASTTHRQMSRKDRLALGLSDGLVRISMGIENPEDLIADFLGALAKL